MSVGLLIIIVLVVLLLGGGGGYYYGGEPRYAYGGLGFVLIVLLLIYLLRPGLFK